MHVVQSLVGSHHLWVMARNQRLDLVFFSSVIPELGPKKLLVLRICVFGLNFFECGYFLYLSAG